MIQDRESGHIKNGGHQDYDHTTTLKTVHFEVLKNDKSLANIICFSTMAFKFRITINTEFYPSINIHLQYDTRIILKQ